MKKTLKRIALVLIATPFVLATIAAIVYFTYALLAVGGESTQHQAYLKKHMQEVTLGENKFDIFDEAFYNSKVIMLGEVHGFAKPQELDFELLKHLNQKTGLTHYLAEVDHSQAYFLNQYLATGDEKLLDYVYQTWVDLNAQWANKESYNKMQKIYAYNQTLPTNKRITIVGVDRIHDTDVTKRHLTELLQTANYKTGSDAIVDSLTQHLTDSTTENDALRTFASNNLKAELELPQTIATELQHIFTNLHYQQQNIARDSVMFLNLKNLAYTNNWQNEQFYGMWGLMHMLQNKVNGGYTSFAAHLKNNDSPFRNKITTINIMATDSENMIPAGMMPKSINKGQAYVNTTWVNSDGPMVFVNGIKDLKAVTKENSVAIFKLNAQDSPYKSSALLSNTSVLMPGQGGVKPDAENATITQACQYVVLIRNSKAATPIKAML
ncbi:TraB/GumN family protein [Pontibacter fetidus]|uniref:Erythromycin esterase family protein n=1 Tax=Pontibacter fetidus TaxID=2700082 RepID=A0A6B2H8G5_9BACT|nr:erythromycin esterase family protein [Pontibacter fetidus]NDK56877.1 erythromycin esterase family protein [Pontibacter fetidus]